MAKHFPATNATTWTFIHHLILNRNVCLNILFISKASISKVNAAFSAPSQLSKGEEKSDC